MVVEWGEVGRGGGDRVGGGRVGVGVVGWVVVEGWWVV